MPRYKLTLEYDGTGLAGWQMQEGQRTVQSILEEAIYLFCGERITAHSAGRTDAGVHARGQVAHIDLSDTHPAFTVMQALNFHLIGQPLIVVDCMEVADDFHARFSATRRHYRYTITNRRARSVLDATYSWHIPVMLNIDAMQEAANQLLGTHDFTSFRDSHCQSKSPIKTLESLTISRAGENVYVTTSARSFLHHQVRIMTGTLVNVGKEKWTISDVKNALESCSRAAAGPTAPAGGLCFMSVEYGADASS